MLVADNILMFFYIPDVGHPIASVTVQIATMRATTIKVLRGHTVLENTKFRHSILTAWNCEYTSVPE